MTTKLTSVLDLVAENLEARGAAKLAAFVDTANAGFREADALHKKIIKLLMDGAKLSKHDANKFVENLVFLDRKIGKDEVDELASDMGIEPLSDAMIATVCDLFAKSKKAVKAKLVSAEDAADPDSYHKEHGRCPEGYHYDATTQKCEKKADAPEEPKTDEAPPADAPKAEEPKPEDAKPSEPANDVTIQPEGPPTPVEPPAGDKPAEEPKQDAPVDAPVEAPKPKRKKKSADEPAAEPVKVTPVPAEKKKGLLSSIGDAFQKADEKLQATLSKISETFKSGSGSVGSKAKSAGKKLYEEVQDGSVGVVGATVAVALGLNPLVAFGLAAYFMYKRGEARAKQPEAAADHVDIGLTPKLSADQMVSADADADTKDLELAFKDMLNADPDELGDLADTLGLGE